MLWRFKEAYKLLTCSYNEFHAVPFQDRFLEKAAYLTDPLDYTSLNYSIHISLRDRYVFVETPKVACSTLKLSLNRLELRSLEFELNENDHIHHRPSFPLLRPSQVPVFDEVMKSADFFRFCFVRNPYTRLLAAYLDKIMRNQIEKRGILLALGHNRFRLKRAISFGEFVEGIKRQTTFQRDAHWRPQSVHTYVDRISYDFIGHLETFKDDVKKVFARLNPNGTDYISRHDHHKTGASGKLSDYFTPEILKSVNEIYDRDFEAFGYRKLESIPEDPHLLKQVLRPIGGSGESAGSSFEMSPGPWIGNMGRKSE